MKKMVVAIVLILLVSAQAWAQQSVIQALDPEFSQVVSPDALLDEIASGHQFTEGPVWVDSAQAGGYLLFSDIPADRIYRWRNGVPNIVWREPSGKSNGLILDAGGQLVACEHWNRRVTLTRKDGEVVTLCDSYRGKKLNSPNDAAVGGDGSIWFTDPPYGLEKRERELDRDYVFRLGPGENEPRAMIDDFDRPNGLVFSPDKKILYVADSGKPHHIRSFRIEGDSLSEIGVFAVVTPGAPDGMCVDSEGRLYTTAGDGVHVYNSGGKLIGKILTPQTPANCCFGGGRRHTLFITARTSVYKIRLEVQGLP